ncbi:hypothetical protein D3C79_761500 [compost metagenome]
MDVEEAAFEVERLLGRPGAPDNLQVLVGTPVALGLVQQGVTFLRLGGDAGDRVQADAPAAGGVVEGGECPRSHRRRGERRAVGDHEAEAFGVRGRIGGNLQAVGATGAAGDQHAVETGLLMGAGMVADERQVEVG